MLIRLCAGNLNTGDSTIISGNKEYEVSFDILLACWLVETNSEMAGYRKRIYFLSSQLKYDNTS